MTLSRRAGAGWGSWLVRLDYRGDDPSDPGEAAALAVTHQLLPHPRVLDLGVGGGRTTTLLAGRSASYVGIDSSPAMVKMARARHPDVDLRLGDARDLAAIGDGAVDLVVFSHNGIDCLVPQERADFLADAHRVLAPSGLLLFSTLNLDGPSYGEKPVLPDLRGRLAERGLRRTAQGLPGTALRAVLAQRNYSRNRNRAAATDDWALAPLRTHEFRFVVHFVRLGAVRRQVHESGFDVLGAWTNTGQPVDPAAERHPDDYVHLLCRRR